jgi:hypothetical protein
VVVSFGLWVRQEGRGHHLCSRKWALSQKCPLFRPRGMGSPLKLCLCWEPRARGGGTVQEEQWLVSPYRERAQITTSKPHKPKTRRSARGLVDCGGLCLCRGFLRASSRHRVAWYQILHPVGGVWQRSKPTKVVRGNCWASPLWGTAGPASMRCAVLYHVVSCGNGIAPSEPPQLWPSSTFPPFPRSGRESGRSTSGGAPCIAKFYQIPSARCSAPHASMI